MVPGIDRLVVNCHITQVLILVVHPSKNYQKVAESVHGVPVSWLRRGSFGINSLPFHAVDVHEVYFPKVIKFQVPIWFGKYF